MRAIATALSVASLLLAGCGDSAKLPEQAAIGPNPPLPEPTKTLIPTVNIATAKGWPNGETPKAASGLAVTAFAGGLDHPRWVTVLPNGDVLVAETNAPERPEEGKGIKGIIMKAVMNARAPPCRAPTASRCYAMPTAMAWRKRGPSFSRA
jgi:glucose/arabinose dehydrogenase